MSECVVCQRTEGVVELPLGPFCVFCIQEISKAAGSSEVKRVRRNNDWDAMWSHLSSKRPRKEKLKDDCWMEYFKGAIGAMKKRVSAADRRTIAGRRPRKKTTVSWAEFWSKAAYEFNKRSVYSVTKSEWMKKWQNTAKNIRVRAEAKAFLSMSESQPQD